jgi:glutaredoxin 3
VKKIELYSTQTCGFCRAAKSLLDDKGISYEEIDISSDPELRGKMVTKANGRRTVPQIFINDAHLGGFL